MPAPSRPPKPAPRKRRPKKAESRPAHRLRIIGGKWRGRQLPFADVPGLRPTTDRTRETLFNWLMHEIAGAHCLDLFAGSGALGLEALSRGAASATFVDRHRIVTQQIQQLLTTLQAAPQPVFTADAVTWLDQPPAMPFDVVFLDPPYSLNLLAPCIKRLAENHYLAPGAWIYLEDAASRPPLDLPENWRIHRQRRTGQVACYLCQTPR